MGIYASMKIFGIRIFCKRYADEGRSDDDWYWDMRLSNQYKQVMTEEQKREVFEFFSKYFSTLISNDDVKFNIYTEVLCTHERSGPQQFMDWWPFSLEQFEKEFNQPL